MINNLKIIRKQKKINQKELAEAIGVSTKIVYKWENCNTTPSIRVALLISHHLNTPLEEIFSIKDEIEKNTKIK